MRRLRWLPEEFLCLHSRLDLRKQLEGPCYLRFLEHSAGLHGLQHTGQQRPARDDEVTHAGPPVSQIPFADQSVEMFQP